jgi:hypothetical protein
VNRRTGGDGPSLLLAADLCLDISSAPASPVSLDYFDQEPFVLNETIGATTIKNVK